MIQKNNPKIINAWCTYDWANSVYALTISSAIFPIYYNSVTRETFGGDIVSFFGIEIENTVLFSYALSFSFLIIALTSPILSGMADTGGIKKTMLRIYTLIGSISCMMMFFFYGHDVEYGIILSITSNIGYAGAIVFYNSFLPIIATKDRHDRISAKGFSWGYLGGVIQLILSLILVMKPELFGMDQDSSLPARISFLTVGIWWLAFAQIPFKYLPKDSKDKKRRNHHIWSRGYHELIKVYQEVKHHTPIKRFLWSFFFYNMGVQTVMLLAATFGEGELHLDSGKLIATILILQLVAIPGAYGFAYISKNKGNKFSLVTMVIIWVFICIGAYYTYTEYQFYVLAIFVGIVMGGIQSLSRSTYSKLIPSDTEDTASYFSFYDVTDKLSVVIGTFTFGFMEQWFGSMRFSALALGVFFIIGLIALFRFPGVQKNQ